MKFLPNSIPTYLLSTKENQIWRLQIVLGGLGTSLQLQGHRAQQKPS